MDPAAPDESDIISSLYYGNILPDSREPGDTFQFMFGVNIFQGIWERLNN